MKQKIVGYNTKWFDTKITEEKTEIDNKDTPINPDEQWSWD